MSLPVFSIRYSLFMQLFMAQNYQAKNLGPKTAKGDFLTEFSWKLCFKKYETFKSNINISYLCFLQRWFKLYRYSSGILPQNYLTNSFAPENGCSWFIPCFPFGEFDYFHGAFAVSFRESYCFHHLSLPQVLPPPWRTSQRSKCPSSARAGKAEGVAPKKIPLNGKGHWNSLKWPGKKNSLKLTVILFTRLKKW